MIEVAERQKSEETYEELKRVIPAGVNSPVRAAFALGITPLVAQSGNADMLTDVDGKEYVDFCMSWGALLFGHAHPRIIQAVEKRLRQGTTFGCTTAIECELAKKVIDFVPSCEKVRFVSSGTEATMSAVRLARAYTAKRRVVKFSGNYHGHADSFLVQAGSGVFGLTPTSSSAGIPEESVKWTVCVPYNDIQAFEELIQDEIIASDVACVIVEPVAANMGVVPAEREFLEYLRNVTKKLGALLIFDEVITGFRLGKNGAQGHFGIFPDITCLGKIVGGGFPAACFGARNEIMDLLAPLGPVYQAGTLSGNPVAMQAGFEALCLLDTPNFYEMLEEKTNILTQPVRGFIKAHNINACLQQAGSCFTLFFGKKKVENANDARQCDEEVFKKFFNYLFEQGIYIPPSQFEAWMVSSVHTKAHLERARDLCLEFLETLL